MLDEHKTVLDLFDNQVIIDPDAVAVEFEGKQLSYRELDSKSNQLARYLVGRQVRPGSLVPICLDNCLEMIIGILGILKAGAAYVPIDHTYPEERIAFLISEIDAKLILTTSDVSARVRFTPEQINLDLDWEKIQKTPATPNPIVVLQSQIAYVIFTSGTTGRPKGVLIDHRNLLAFLLTRISYHHRIEAALLIPSFAFDASIPTLFGTLTTGGKLLLCKRELLRNPSLIQDLLKVSKTLLCVPSYYRFLLEEDLLVPSNVSRVILGGESLDISLVKLHFEKTTNTRLFNEYGPTECTVCATIAEVKSPNEKITIGRPNEFTRIYILDENGELCPTGVPGELCIAGELVGRGYLNRPKLTAEKFIADPMIQPSDRRMYRTGDLAKWLPDGNIEFIGRMDDQIKIRGHRIELGEIETAIQEYKGIKQAAVALKNNSQRNSRLVGYVVHDGSFDKEELIAFLAAKLPLYMIPHTWMALDAFPLTFNGKIDRSALPFPDIESMAAGMPERPNTPLEAKIVEVWRKSLGLEKLGLQDDFFEIGGHSLLAVKVLSRLERELGKKIPVNAIFKYSRIPALANYIESLDEGAVVGDSLVSIKATGSKPPLFIVHGVGSTNSIYFRLAKYMDDDQPIFGFEPKGLNGVDSPNQSLEEMASFYVSLMVRQYPAGPYQLAGYSFGGYVAFEMAQQLKAMGRRVSKLILFDTPAFVDITHRPWPKKLKIQFGRKLVNLAFAFKEPIGFYEQKKRQLARKREQILINLKLMPSLETQKDRESIIKVIARNSAGFLRKYKPSRYDGDICLFKVENRSDYIEDTNQYGWGDFVNKVRVVNVSGHHDNIFKNPKILQEMATKIQMVLDEPIGK